MELNDLLTKIATVALPCLSALVAFLVAYFNMRKSKLELQQRNVELETANVEMQTAFYNGSYIVCPKCGSRIYVKDMVFKNDNKEAK